LVDHPVHLPQHSGCWRAAGHRSILANQRNVSVEIMIDHAHFLIFLPAAVLLAMSGGYVAFS
jgi:hypothetical protein